MSDASACSNRPSGRMNGGRALAEMLRLAGAGPMFGMGGFQLLPFYDALGASSACSHFLINDERCGAFAADAYARVTNRPGICDGTLGPGATNLVTGLVESLNAGIADRRDRRRHQPRAFLEEHDAGMPPGRNPAARGQGADPRRDDEPHPRTGAPRLRGGDLRPAGPGAARRARGRLPRRRTISPPEDFVDRRGDA